MRQLPQLVALQLLRAYKWAISPMFPPACRYVPTCSDYAMEAIERYGAVRGALMAITRLLRCHPFARGGFDPVVKHEASASRHSDSYNSFVPRHGFSRAETNALWIAPSGAVSADNMRRHVIRLER